LILHPETDEPARFRPGTVFKTDRAGDLTVKATRAAANASLVSFHEIANRSEAEAWRGARLFVDPAQRRGLENDEFWPESLIGLRARDTTGIGLGVVADVELGDAQDRLVIADGQQEVRVPLVRALVTEIDVNRGYVVIDAIPGLFPQLDGNSSGISAPTNSPSAGE
jgi:16S rRNA processing protein RimM